MTESAHDLKAVVYSRANCAACEGAKRFLTDNGIAYAEFRFDKPENRDIAEQLIEAGHRAAPVVQVARASDGFVMLEFAGFRDTHQEQIRALLPA